MLPDAKSHAPKQVSSLDGGKVHALDGGKVHVLDGKVYAPFSTLFLS